LSDVALAPNPRTIPAYGLPPGDPTFAGFEWFVANIMNVPFPSIPPTSWLNVAYTMGINLAYTGLQGVPSDPTGPSIYAMAVYNLAGAYLVAFAIDDPSLQPPSNYWSNLQTQYGINSAAFGIITSAADQGTADSLYIPESIKNMTFNDLWLAKTPWGQAYLRIAGQWGYIWGIKF